MHELWFHSSWMMGRVLHIFCVERTVLAGELRALAKELFVWGTASCKADPELLGRVENLLLFEHLHEDRGQFPCV